MNYAKQLEQAEDLSEIFEIAKSVVKEFLGKERSGLMLGLSDLGGASLVSLLALSILLVRTLL